MCAVDVALLANLTPPHTPAFVCKRTADRRPRQLLRLKMMSFKSSAFALLVVVAAFAAADTEDVSGSGSGSDVDVSGDAPATDAGEAGHVHDHEKFGSSGSSVLGADEAVDEGTGDYPNANDSDDSEKARGMIAGFCVAWIIIVAIIMGYIYNGDAVRAKANAAEDAATAV